MSNLVYLLMAFVLSGIGWLVIWLRHRQPTSVEHGIEEFNRELRALAPDQGQPAQHQSRRDVHG